MEKASFKLVRTILSSQQFQSKNVEEQKEVLNKILQTGEITQVELVILINEQINQQQEIKEENKMEMLDYNTFVNVILYGDIKGKDLINLCSSSRKLNEYCNRSFQPLNNQGMPYGEEQTQYLFRLLLNKAQVKIPLGRSPRALYIKKFARTFHYFGYSSIDHGKHVFQLANDLNDMNHKETEEIGKKCSSFTKEELLSYLWSVKVDLYVRVIIPESDDNNIFLIRLNSSDINDIKFKNNRRPEMISLRGGLLPPENRRRYDVVVHYTELYPEILNWVFEDEVSELDISQLIQNEPFYPSSNPNFKHDLPKSIPVIIGIPYGRIVKADVKGMFRLFSNHMRHITYGDNGALGPNYDSLVG
jgi:hypothetical protein